MAVSAAGSAAAQTYSLIVRGGTIYDGSGGAPYVGDVALQGDRIAADLEVRAQLVQRGVVSASPRGDDRAAWRGPNIGRGHLAVLSAAQRGALRKPATCTA